MSNSLRHELTIFLPKFKQLWLFYTWVLCFRPLFLLTGQKWTQVGKLERFRYNNQSFAMFFITEYCQLMLRYLFCQTTESQIWPILFIAHGLIELLTVKLLIIITKNAKCMIRRTNINRPSSNPCGLPKCTLDLTFTDKLAFIYHYWKDKQTIESLKGRVGNSLQKHFLLYSMECS